MIDPAPQTRAERRLHVLDRLAETGLAVAVAVAERAKTAGPEEDLNALAMAHSRVARAVRLTLMLQAKLETDAVAFQEKAEARAAEALHERSETHKARVERVVERIAMAQTDDEETLDRLVIEAGERLDDEDLYPDILDRPVAELVARICKDLGLDAAPISPDAEASGGGGPLANPASAGEERGVEVASYSHDPPRTPQASRH